MRKMGCNLLGDQPVRRLETMAKQDNKQQADKGKDQGKPAQDKKPARAKAPAGDKAASSDGRQNGKTAPGALDGYVPRLRQKYVEEVVPALRKEFGYENVMRV